MKKTSKRVRMSKEDRRAQIIDSAMQLFIENGYHATTTASIAKKAAISEVTLFRHFTSKEELFLEGIQPILTIQLDHSILQAEDMNTEDKLKYILEDRLQFVSENHAILKLILTESQLNPEVVGIDYINHVFALLEEALEKAGIELKNKEIALRLIMGSLLSFLYFPETDQQKIDEYLENLVSTLNDYKI